MRWKEDIGQPVPQVSQLKPPMLDHKRRRIVYMTTFVSFAWLLPGSSLALASW
jgi:hypothetical protein